MGFPTAKKDQAMELGADKYVASTDEESMKSAAFSLDLIINTVSANHQATMYFPIMKRNGVQVMLGLTKEPHKVKQTNHFSSKQEVKKPFISVFLSPYVGWQHGPTLPQHCSYWLPHWHHG